MKRVGQRVLDFLGTLGDAVFWLLLVAATMLSAGFAHGQSLGDSDVQAIAQQVAALQKQVAVPAVSGGGDLASIVATAVAALVGWLLRDKLAARGGATDRLHSKP